MRKFFGLILLVTLIILAGCKVQSTTSTTATSSTTTAAQSSTTSTTTTSTTATTATTQTTSTTMPNPIPVGTSLINIDGNSGGGTFAGYGLVSSGTDTLLMDYPDNIRQQILDYLFKPDYGPDIKLLKVEIGGGSNDTTIANASYEPVEGQYNYWAGYDWKLITEVKAVNPDVKIEGLDWSLPGWVTTPDKEAQYIFGWVKEMRDVHGVTVDYIGGQRNEEEPLDPTMTIELRQLLDENGFSSVQIVAADSVFNPWTVASEMMTNQAYDNAVDVIGVHYIGSQMPTYFAKETGKPIWDSEEPGWNPNDGTFGNVKLFISNYVDKGITGLQTWGLSQSLYTNMFWNMIGIITANSPWSGYWQPAKGNWAIAHINQFADFGWKFINSASGKLDDGVSYYTTMKSPDNSNYDVLMETFDATKAQNVEFQLSNGMPADKPVYVWTSQVNSDNPNDWFYQEATITPVNGQYSYTVQPGRVYNFVTTTGQGKQGLDVTIPANTPWNLPVDVTFDNQTVGERPKYFVDEEGTFEVTKAKGGRSGNALEQVAIGNPIRWYGAATDPYPLTEFGYPDWTNYKASVDVLLENPGYVDLAIRAGEPAMQQKLSRKGYYIRLNSDGTWQLLRIQLIQSGKYNYVKVLASGSVGAVDLNTWYNIGVSATGDQISAYFNGQLLTTVTDSTFTSGNIFLETSGYQYSQFDNLEITSTTTS